MISRLTPKSMGVDQGKDGVQKEYSTKRDVYMQNALN